MVQEGIGMVEYQQEALILKGIVVTVVVVVVVVEMMVVARFAWEAFLVAIASEEGLVGQVDG